MTLTGAEQKATKKAQKKAWDDVEAELLEAVFYAHDPARVRASTDLARDRMLDSLSIVAIIEVLAEASDADEALDAAGAEDFRSLATIRELYARL